MSAMYELMLVVRPDVEVTEQTAPKIVAGMLGEGIKVTDIAILGKKSLAYPIKKQTEGMYVLAQVSGDVLVGDIEKRVQLGTEVLRFLLTAKK
jgi:small subunit ribosomal protein S6